MSNCIGAKFDICIQFGYGCKSEAFQQGTFVYNPWKKLWDHLGDNITAWPSDPKIKCYWLEKICSKFL